MQSYAPYVLIFLLAFNVAQAQQEYQAPRQLRPAPQRFPLTPPVERSGQWRPPTQPRSFQWERVSDLPRWNWSRDDEPVPHTSTVQQVGFTKVVRPQQPRTQDGWSSSDRNATSRARTDAIPLVTRPAGRAMPRPQLPATVPAVGSPQKPSDGTTVAVLGSHPIRVPSAEVVRRVNHTYRFTGPATQTVAKPPANASHAVPTPRPQSASATRYAPTVSPAAVSLPSATQRTCPKCGRVHAAHPEPPNVKNPVSSRPR